jgi:uncharacterized coiled-coil DUF342 family protein
MIRFYKFLGLNNTLRQSHKIQEECREHYISVNDKESHDRQVEELMDTMQACFNQLMLLCDTPDKLQRADTLHNLKMQQRRSHGHIHFDDEWEGRLFICKENKSE